MPLFIYNSTHSPANMDDSPIITHSHMLPSSPVCGRPVGSFNVTWIPAVRRNIEGKVIALTHLHIAHWTDIAVRA